MRRVFSLVTFRTLTLICLSASAALLYDYTRPLPAFCASGSGCEAVRSSQFAYVFGVPQPAFGLVAFLVLFGLTFAPHQRRRKLLLPVAVLGAIAGAAFLAIQAFSLGVFCSLCVVVDVSAILLAVVASIHHGAPAQGSDGALPPVGWTALCGLAVGLPLLFGAARPEPPVPPAVAALWVPGKLNIIELSDFECPFCRILHPSLKEAIEAYGERVHLVRVSVPLKSHSNAENATKGYLCARHQGKGEAMAHELFVSERLDPAAIKEMTDRVGLDTQAFDHCFTGEQAQRSLHEE
ncbi:MAG: thioredoxin domain-containing protein, partial [Polyangiaceae bacterium]|nr:thioredoxin domain-containing protein [Polyangiaceae bacterium]